VADGRHRQIDPRVVHDRFGRGHAQHLTIAGQRPAAQTNRIDGQAHVSGRALGRARRVAAIGQHDHAGDHLAAISLANGCQRRAKVGPACGRRQLVGGDGRDIVSEAEDFRAEAVLERRQETLRDDGARSIDASDTPGVLNAHAPRRVDEDRDHGIASGSIVGRGHGPHQEEDEEQERDEADAGEDRPAEQGSGKMTVREPCRRAGGANDENEDPPGERVRERHAISSSAPATRSTGRSGARSRQARGRCRRR
jgi:hypothetical protein